METDLLLASDHGIETKSFKNISTFGKVQLLNFDLANALRKVWLDNFSSSEKCLAIVLNWIISFTSSGFKVFTPTIAITANNFFIFSPKIYYRFFLRKKLFSMATKRTPRRHVTSVSRLHDIASWDPGIKIKYSIFTEPAILYVLSKRLANMILGMTLVWKNTTIIIQ